MRCSASIGIDTHAKKNQICAIDSRTGEIKTARLSADPREPITWIEAQDLAKPARCCFESGPAGFGPAGDLNDVGICCIVAATSKLPYRIDRQKNDRVDAEWLARMPGAGSVRSVMVPTVGEESLRHLSRLRGEVARDLRKARKRVASFLPLTKTGHTLTERRWTRTFNQWAESHGEACGADTFTFRMEVSAALRLEERLQEVEDEMIRIINLDPELADRMARFQATHGRGEVSAISLVCEVYDLECFRDGAALASFSGLVPSESSTGDRNSKGGIAKTGNSHLRRLVIESASCYSRPIRDVRAGDPSVPEGIRAKAGKCRHRLEKRRQAPFSKSAASKPIGSRSP